MRIASLLFLLSLVGTLQAEPLQAEPLQAEPLQAEPVQAEPLQAQPFPINLWPGDALPGPAPFAKGEERDLTKPDDRLIAGRPIIRLGHASRPQVLVYPAPVEKANGTAVVVCPGGGFSILAWDLEGTEVAEWLNRIGITALVLKYRAPTRQHPAGEDPESIPTKALGPVMDAQRALSIARVNAEAWKIDPDRVGVLGFSAGGETAALAATALGERAYDPVDEVDEAPCRVDFALLVYPGGLADRETGAIRPHVRITGETPPMFFAHAADDRATCLASSAMFQALKLAGVPAALHIYETGGHGYGLRATSEPVTKWPDRAEEWLDARGLLAPSAPPTGGYQSREGHPADHLPSYIQQVSGFGERPEWSHDGRSILFVDKPMGEVYELDLDTGLIEPKTRHFHHHGFTRAVYLANGHILLSGPDAPFDTADRDERERARDLCVLSILDPDSDEPPVSLGTYCAEGPAVSRTRMRIAWTHRDKQHPEIGENHARLLVAEVGYEDGMPRLVDRRVVFDSHHLPFPLGRASLETQNLVPPGDTRLTFSVYGVDGGTNTDTYVVNIETGEFENLTRSPDHYDEPEGVFPDGLSTCVEHAPSLGRPWPLCDIYQLRLDRSGEMRRLTHFSDFRGFKGTQGVVSPDGTRLCFQIGKSGDEAGVGYGFFVMDLAAAEPHLEPFQSPATEPHPAERLARRFETAWNSGEPLPAISSLDPGISLEQAYDIQRAWVRETLDNAGIGGVKGGVVSPGGQEWLGITEPVGAILRASGRFEAKDKPTISMARFPGLKLETEIGFVVGKRIEGPLASVDEFREHVEAIVPAIELVSGAWEAPEGKPTAADLAAINVTASGYIVGEPIAPDATDPGAATLRLSLEDKTLHEAPGSDCWKGPWETGFWLANFAHRQGVVLEPGQVILCGALGKIQPAEVGDYVYDAGALGTIRFSVSDPK